MKKIVVTPGETLAYAEEFEVKGAAYGLDHRYISSVLGTASFDEKTHTAVVKPLKDPVMPQPGSVVYCQVTGKGRRVYYLRCFAVEGQKGPVDLKYTFTGVLPYIFADGELGIGDYIRAKVVSTSRPASCGEHTRRHLRLRPLPLPSMRLGVETTWRRALLPQLRQ
jgi:exosome complex component CSL4